MAGLFITFEGGEGAGKSTQIQMLKSTLETMGKEVLLTREPGGSKGGELIRPLLVSGEADWDAVSETLLFSAARRDHLTHKIWPALKEGKIVLCDRFSDSTLAYQGYGRGNNLEIQKVVTDLYKIVAGDFEPDLTLILDIDPKIGLKRSCERTGNTEKRFENMDFSFHENLRTGFLKIAQENPTRCHVIDANRSLDEIHQKIMEIVKEKL
ncbi:MAG: dTMP kinase [Alphaproteobacteria bacterium]|nr:dTMP kinase [Alphaproteobacteria bacterium]